MAETGCDAGASTGQRTSPMRAAVWAIKSRCRVIWILSMLYAPPARIEEEVATILAGFGHGEGHVFNLGHGIHQDAAGRTCWRVRGGSASTV
ncbi:uroporphyrinogen decarboxylase family protein [Escherichia coli]